MQNPLIPFLSLVRNYLLLPSIVFLSRVKIYLFTICHWLPHCPLPLFFPFPLFHPWLMYSSPYLLTRFSSHMGTIDLAKFPRLRLELLMQSFFAKGSSEDVAPRLIRDVEAVSFKYTKCTGISSVMGLTQIKFSSHRLSVNHVCKYLIYMLDTGLSASTPKFLRSLPLFSKWISLKLSIRTF